MSEPTQDAIGKLLDGMQSRDAIHIAVYPVIAARTCRPAQHVGLNKEGQADPLGESTVGIVDPFLKEPARPGERFFIFLYPNTITGLRHVWTHPVLDSQALVDRAASEKWLREFAEEHFHDYYDTPGFDSYAHLLRAAEEADFCLNSQPDWLYSEGAQEKQELWTHLEVLRGSPYPYSHKASANFRCSC